MTEQDADYRAEPITQRDGTTLANSNCRMASIATGLDYHTHGRKTSTGARMRSHQDDQSGGTDARDAKQAWSEGYDENLDIQDGYSFDDALADLKARRLIHLDVWHATTGGPCLSGSGAYGHTMAVAPEAREVEGKTQWLVADPWCRPGRWTWWSEAKLRAGAEEWGRRVFNQTQGQGIANPTLDDLRRAAKVLMTRYHAGGPEDRFTTDPGHVDDTGGGGRIMYTATKAHSDKESESMAVQAAGGVTSEYQYHVGAGTDFYYDGDCTQRIGDMSKDGTVRDMGATLREDVTGGSRAVLVNTGIPYNDGQTRPTIVYMKVSTLGEREHIPPAPLPTPGDCTDAVVEAVGKRDAAWQTWLLAGSPGERDDTRKTDT